MTVGENIANARYAAQVSQRELAERVGISTGQIGQIETGARIPNVVTAKKIADELGVKLDELFK